VRRLLDELIGDWGSNCGGWNKKRTGLSNRAVYWSENFGFIIRTGKTRLHYKWTLNHGSRFFMPTPTWFAAFLDEIVPLILARPIRELRWVRLARNGAISQYDVIFRTCTGSGGHANVYLIKTVSNGTLIITGQVADRNEGVQVLENDHDLAFTFGRTWLIRVGHLSAAMGELHHFTADMDTGELTLTWREGEVHGWTPFPHKAAFISQIEDQFAVRLFAYCGVRPARHCAPRMTTSLRVSLATSIGRPVQSSPLSKRARMTPGAALVRWTRSIPSRALTLCRFSTAKIQNWLYPPSNCPAFIGDRNRACLKPDRQLKQRVGTKENRYLRS
jgi:hypothetical protein